MAATFSITNPAPSRESLALKGVRRARYSFHFVTRRTRRWLLVQWVSVPRETSESIDLTDVTDKANLVWPRRGPARG